jgi:DNA repair exonuclease SbcCD nuclease subunit
MQGQVPHMHGGLSPGEVAPLRPPVDYLALGHVHKRLVGLDGWIFNPGSTETNSMEEAEWPHGFFDVTVDTSADPKHSVEYVATPGLRAFDRISVSADEARTLDDFVGLAERKIATHMVRDGAVVELHMGGVAQFKKHDVPVERLKAAIQLRFSPLIVRIRNTIVAPGQITVGQDERVRRSELESRIIEQMVYQQSEYRDRAAAWTRVILDVKNMAAEQDLPASIVDYVETALERMASSDVSASPNGDGHEAAAVEPERGEQSSMARLFPDW